MNDLKKISLFAMIFTSGIAANAHADYYYQDSRSSCPSCQSNDGYYQDGGYYRDDGRRYYRNDNRGYYRNDERGYYRSDDNRGYYQNDNTNPNQNQNVNPNQNQNVNPNQNPNPSNQNQSGFRPNNKNYVSDNAYQGTAQMPDAELAKQIQDKLDSGWFSKSYAGVTAQVNNGNVVLQGQVASWEDKSKLESEIRNMKGVASLNSQITVRDQNAMERPTQNMDEQPRSEFPQDKAMTPTDRQLNQKIRDNISKSWFGTNYNEIALNTKNGIVTLEGTIKNPGDQQKLVSEIQKIEGVKSVRSDLRILNNK